MATYRRMGYYVTVPVLGWFAYNSKPVQQLIGHPHNHLKEVGFACSPENPLAQGLENTELYNVAKSYHPPLWLTLLSHKLWGLHIVLYGLVKESRFSPNFEQRTYDDEEHGYYTIDFTRCEARSSNFKKVILVFPGVTGSSEENYIKDMVGAANAEGYQVAVLNHLYTAGGPPGQRVLSLGNGQIVKEVVQNVKNYYGEDSRIYAVGFSLGSNNMMRYIGGFKDKTSFKAAVCISNPYDCYETCTRMSQTFFGIYDYYLTKKISGPFIAKQFKICETMSSETIAHMQNSWGLLEFDDKVRAPYFGFSSSEELYKHMSCARYLRDVEIPFMVMHARDDAITPASLMPKFDLLANPNALVLETETGGHCEFYTHNKSAASFLHFGRVQRHFPEVVLAYLGELERRGIA